MRLLGALSWAASVRARAFNRGREGPDCLAASALRCRGRGAMPDMSSLRCVTMTEIACIVLPMPCQHQQRLSCPLIKLTQAWSHIVSATTAWQKCVWA